jgi:hypothetical protein
MTSSSVSAGRARAGMSSAALAGEALCAYQAGARGAAAAMR